PLLYQVATAGLSEPEIAAPIRHVLRKQSNTTVLLADAIAIDPARHIVRLAEGEEIGYDTLIVATGATHAYFGHDEWEPLAPGLKTIEDALIMRSKMLQAFETAEREQDLERRKRHLTFVIVGGGPTGVELAGAIREIAQRTMTGDFRHFDPASTRVLLIDAGPRLLAAYPPDLSQRARKMLEERGVEVITDALVTAIDEHGVTAGGKRIDAGTIFWAAGVKPSPIGRTLGAPLDRAGRVLVEPDLTVPGHPEIFVIGDLAAMKSKGEWVPGVAQGAIQSGRHAGRMVKRRLQGKPTQPFRFKDLGLLATIGRKAAVAVVGRGHFWGFPAWFLWLSIHIVWLIGFRNRIVVLLDWLWAYLRYQSSARVILTEPPTPEPPSEPARSAEPALRG
ncbi:MAG TPA: NAD(P)/FAD-dependent oxidoreductase, partial [Candidatus Eisenbacteria bacterium]|nr:NAD(P)/FAD-dependent oxidoreductase [Candidatus Eisenbacteria bacterium]